MIPTWSSGALLSIMRCQEAFRRRYVEREEVPATVRMRRGAAVASVAREIHLRQKRARDAARAAGQDELGAARVEAMAHALEITRAAIPSMTEARDLAATEYDRLIRDHGVTLTDEERAEGEARVVGAEKDHSVDAAGYYALRVAPNVTPIAVEREVVIEPPGYGVRLRGTMDLVDLQHDPAGAPLEILRDLKTSAKSPPPNEADKSDQLTLYSILRLAETGSYPPYSQLDYLVRSPRWTQVKHVPLRTTRDDRDTNAFLAKLETAVRSVEAGAYMPNTTGWHCDAKWCPYFGTCRYVSDRRK